MIPVWDRLVRLLHWTLVAAIAAAWITTETSTTWHEGVGYVAAGVVALRIVWGFVGPRRARFADFVRAPGAVIRYATDVLGHREARHVGHNPLGGWMTLLLLACIAGTCVTGWLFTTDAFWGEAWVSALHEALAWILVVLIALHVAGVVHASIRQKENLVRAMIRGTKREARGSDVD